MNLTFKQFEVIWSGMTATEQQAVKDKCRWEAMGRWAILNEWSNLIPERLVPVEVEK